jgi:hypothetical protein
MIPPYFMRLVFRPPILELIVNNYYSLFRLPKYKTESLRNC